MSDPIFVAVVASMAVLAQLGLAEADSDLTTAREVTVPQQADNTGKNIEDRGDASALTADDQGLSPKDVNLAATIRREIVKDDALSTNAHNIKIIVKDGTITLRGPVDSKGEKDAIVAIANKYSTPQTIRDQTEVLQR